MQKKMRKNEPIKAEEKYIPKTDDELKGIAKDLWAGRIFSDRHINSLKDDSNVLGMVFMPMVFISNETRKKLSNLKVSFIYEYLDKASPRSINGMPVFVPFAVFFCDQAFFYKIIQPSFVVHYVIYF